MKLLIFLLAIVAVAAAQSDAPKPADKPNLPFTRIDPKARRLTLAEMKMKDYIDMQWEAFGRGLCESINVKWSDCQIAEGLVFERQAPPLNPTVAPTSAPPQAKK